MFREAGWSDNFEFKWEDVFELIKNMPVNENYELKWSNIDEDKVMKLLVDEHDFSEERVRLQIDAMRKVNEKKGQKGLGEFLG